MEIESKKTKSIFLVGDGPKTKIFKIKSQSNISIFHSQAGASSDPRRECENRYIVWW